MLGNGNLVSSVISELEPVSPVCMYGDPVEAVMVCCLVCFLWSGLSDVYCILTTNKCVETSSQEVGECLHWFGQEWRI
jgi:hypothetical protein